MMASAQLIQDALILFQNRLLASSGKLGFSAILYCVTISSMSAKIMDGAACCGLRIRF
jgi:hypothetical protein